LTLDPHKWLFQPLEAGCVLVRDGAALERTFSIAPSYLRAVAPAGNEISFADRGIELTRSFRALKLWMSMKTFGAAAFRTAIEHGMALAEHAQTLLAADPTWEVVTPAQLGVVTFRATAAGASDDEIEAVNAQLPGVALRDGFAFVNTTRVGQATVLRLCPINPRTTIEDVERSLERLALLARGAFDERTR
jgi:aromatic-L-amino-acid/L-tryptophan decarboxylase